jgi:hypothetical protein
MNRYGMLALEHWTKSAPSKVAQLENPSEFFEDLGEQVGERVATLSREIEAQTPAKPDFMDQVRQLTAIRKQAEEIVLTDLVWLAPDQVEYDEAEAASQELGELPDLAELERQIRYLQEDQSDPVSALLTAVYEERLASLQEMHARVVVLEAKIPEGY